MTSHVVEKSAYANEADKDTRVVWWGQSGSRMLKVAWLGQTVASLAWITSVFSYGISQTGDWLQLVAACSWLIANIAAIAGPKAADTDT